MSITTRRIKKVNIPRYLTIWINKPQWIIQRVVIRGMSRIQARHRIHAREHAEPGDIPAPVHGVHAHFGVPRLTGEFLSRQVRSGAASVHELTKGHVVVDFAHRAGAVHHSPGASQVVGVVVVPRGSLATADHFTPIAEQVPMLERYATAVKSIHRHRLSQCATQPVGAARTRIDSKSLVVVAPGVGSRPAHHHAQGEVAPIVARGGDLKVTAADHRVQPVYVPVPIVGEFIDFLVVPVDDFVQAVSARRVGIVQIGVVRPIVGVGGREFGRGAGYVIRTHPKKVERNQPHHPTRN